MSLGTPTEEVQSAAAVFTGRVVAVAPVEEGPFQGWHGIAFEVTESWKRAGEGNVMVFAPRSSAGCGFNVREAEHWLVYALGTFGPMLTTSQCTWTARLDSPQSRMALRTLGPGTR